MLVTTGPARRLFFPRWIGGYAACLEEIHRLGVPALPPNRRTRRQIVAGAPRPRHRRLRRGVGHLGGPSPVFLQRIGLGGLALVVIARTWISNQLNVAF